MNSAKTRSLRTADCDCFLVGRPGNGRTLDWLTSLNVITNFRRVGCQSKDEPHRGDTFISWHAPVRMPCAPKQTHSLAAHQPHLSFCLIYFTSLIPGNDWGQDAENEQRAPLLLKKKKLAACWDEQHSFSLVFFPSHSHCLSDEWKKKALRLVALTQPSKTTIVAYLVLRGSP